MPADVSTGMVMTTTLFSMQFFCLSVIRSNTFWKDNIIKIGWRDPKWFSHYELKMIIRGIVSASHKYLQLLMVHSPFVVVQLHQYPPVACNIQQVTMSNTPKMLIPKNSCLDGTSSGGCLNIKMSSYQYRNYHVKDKTVSPTILSSTWESPYWERRSLYWNRAHGTSRRYQRAWEYLISTVCWRCTGHCADWLSFQC